MSRRNRIDLMVNSTGTGNAYDWPGGMGELTVDATAWGGGNVVLQKQAQSGKWLLLDAANLTLYADGVIGFVAAAGPIRVVATTATGVNVSATGIPTNNGG